MKKLFLLVLIVSMATLSSGCSKQNSIASKDETTEDRPSYKVEMVQSSTGAEIARSMDILSIEEALADIQSIDFYHEPQLLPEYTTEIITHEDEDSDARDINYYDSDQLIYTIYEGYGEEGFAYYTETIQGLKSTVKYYKEEGAEDSIEIETDRYHIYIDELNDSDPFGIGRAGIILYPAEQIPPFKCVISYWYTEGRAYDQGALYLKDGEFLRYECDAQMASTEACESMEHPTEAEIQDYIDKKASTQVIVRSFTGKVSTDVVNAMLEDPGYMEADIRIGNNLWYYDDTGWYVTDTVSLIFEEEKAAEEYKKKHSLVTANVEECYGFYTVTIPDVTLQVSLESICDGNTLQAFVMYDVEESFYKEIILDGKGVITEMKHTVTLSP